MKLRLFYRYPYELLITMGIVASLSFYTDRNRSERPDIGFRLSVAAPVPDDAKPSMPPEIDELTIPLKNAGRLFMIEALVDGQSGNLIFDSGAETNAISDHSSRSVLSTVSVDRKSNLGGAGQRSVEVLIGTMNDFVLSGHQLKNMGTIITHLDTLNEAYGLEIDGMLGYDFLTKGTICINFTRKQLGMKFLNVN